MGFGRKRCTCGQPRKRLNLPLKAAASVGCRAAASKADSGDPAARLGLDRSVQGTGLGGDLLRDALARCAAAADEIGGRAVLVHAKDAGAAAFYQRHGFVPLEQNLNHLYVLMKDLRASIRRSCE